MAWFCIHGKKKEIDVSCWRNFRQNWASAMYPEESLQEIFSKKILDKTR